VNTSPAVTPARPAPAEIEPASAALPSLFDQIARQPFFKGLNAPQLQLLTDSAMEMQFETGQSILEEGSVANRFYLILEGAVVLELQLDAYGAVIPIQTLAPGDIVGWSWLFPPYSVHLGARALTPVKTIFFYGTRLREQCEQDHELGFQLMKRIAEVATQCLQASQQRLVACINPDKLP
jgi:CRP/FNR family cyclic AMP-dependent transcriptional regulator